MATIEDVARLAKVSTMTVSRVINNSGPVKDSTRERVTQAIAELNYRPNMMAKGLVTRRSHIIAYVVADISDPFHAEVSKGVEEVCYKRGYITMVCDTHNKIRESDYANMFIDRQIDGVVFHHLNIEKEQIDELESSGVMCIMMDNESNLEKVCSVNTNNYMGARMAAKHLVDCGHSNIACMHGPLEPCDDKHDTSYLDTFQFRIWRERTQGFVDGVRAHGLEPTVFYKSDSGMEYALQNARKVISNVCGSTTHATAIYCENDIMALSVLSEALERGVAVPDKLAIVGHDGIETSMLLFPRVTTIVQPRYEMGVKAANMLIDRIEGNTDIKNIILNSKLFKGSTT